MNCETNRLFVIRIVTSYLINTRNELDDCNSNLMSVVRLEYMRNDLKTPSGFV